MAPERQGSFAHHEDGRTVMLELQPGEERWPFRLTGRYVDIELSESDLEWLCFVGGPAALVAHRGGPSTPAPTARST